MLESVLGATPQEFESLILRHTELCTCGIEDVRRYPFNGIGKPEPLRHHLPGAWSRRIDEEHRLVYIVTEAGVIILAARYHY